MKNKCPSSRRPSSSEDEAENIINVAILYQKPLEKSPEYLLYI